MSLCLFPGTKNAPYVKFCRPFPQIKITLCKYLRKFIHDLRSNFFFFFPVENEPKSFLLLQNTSTDVDYQNRLPLLFVYHYKYKFVQVLFIFVHSSPETRVYLSCPLVYNINTCYYRRFFQILVLYLWMAVLTVFLSTFLSSSNVPRYDSVSFWVGMRRVLLCRAHSKNK